MSIFPQRALRPNVRKREVFGWAMYDFANSGYTTVVLTAVYNAYFVSVVAQDASWATLAWTILIAMSNAIGMVLMPVIGAWADAHAKKKLGLIVATIVCIVGTIGLSFTGEGSIPLAAVMLILSNLAFNVGETLNSAFLPELASDSGVGKVSGWGWSLGYCGGLVTLGLSLVLVKQGPQWGIPESFAVTGTLWITALVFFLATIPTFLWLKERNQGQVHRVRQNVGEIIAESFRDLKETLRSLPQYQAFARLTFCGFLYQSGVSVVITLSAVYASSVMGFTLEDTLLMVFLVNITAAIGAFVFGYFEDRLGHKRGLMLTLWVWLAMVGVAASTESVWGFWLAANLAGLAMGASQSAGRAMVSVLSPKEKSASFYSFWNMALWLANIVGPLTYGVVTWITNNNHRLAISLTGLFFLFAILVLMGLREKERA